MLKFKKVYSALPTGIEDEFFTACYTGNLDELQVLLLMHNCSVDYKRDMDGRTFLMHSAFHFRISIIEFLIEQGADLNASDNFGWENDIDITKKTYDGETALELAKICKDEKIISLLSNEEIR